MNNQHASDMIFSMDRVVTRQLGISCTVFSLEFDYEMAANKFDITDII